MDKTTQCSHCHTIFFISDEQLQQGHKHVRCGQCRKLFKVDLLDPNYINENVLASLNAIENLIDSIPEKSLKNDIIGLRADSDFSFSSYSIEREYKKKKPKKRALYKRFAKSKLAIFSVMTINFLLFITLTYNLWYHAPLTPYNPTQITKFSDWITPVVKILRLPSRRNINQLKIVSVQNTLHPSKKDTTLLKLQFLNRATFTQTLPRIQIVLHNASGEILARRMLTPEQYVYNNRTDELIGANELKKITTELYAFPEQATGYEVKIIDDPT